MDTGTTTTIETGVTIEQLKPYLDSTNSNLTLTNSLLIFLIVYLILKDISTYIKSFISGGFV